MKVSKAWLKQLVDKVSIEEVERLLPLRTIGTKEVTDDFIELDMKGYNRADLLSIRGVAREVAAITDSTVTFHDETVPETDLPKTKVSVEDEKLCPVYCIAKIEGLKSGPSKPQWVKKLTDSGMRSVNNIADVTNLVMLEFGQPMHSFDAQKVTDETLIVRHAKKGESIKTLDEKIRKLSEEDLLITDPEKPLGIAGVMGGKESEASDSTTSIFLEAAIFDPKSTRKSTQRHGIYSEAGKRFQHGLTKTNLLQALSSAIKMYEDLGGKLTAISLIGDLEDKPKTVRLTQEKVNSLIGINIKSEEVEKSLRKLGFYLGVLSGTPPRWDVTVPYFRLDVEIEEDLIEEVARMYGYENISAKELTGKLPEKVDQTLFEKIYNTKKSLADAGLTEVQTYSFVSTQVLKALGANEENLKNALKVANPISSETEYLRTSIWPNLIEVIERNTKQGFEDIAVFEIGKVYNPVKDEPPKESYRLSIALMNGTDNPIQELASISRSAKLPHTGCVQNGENFHPNRFTETMAEVHPRILNIFGIEKRVAILEIEMRA